MRHTPVPELIALHVFGFKNLIRLFIFVFFMFLNLYVVYAQQYMTEAFASIFSTNFFMKNSVNCEYFYKKIF